MIKHSRLVKALTLFSFIFLITAFLLYRTGSFETYLSGKGSDLQTSHNGGTIKPARLDSLLPSTMDSSERLMMYSSKSMVLVDKKINLFDSIIKKKKKFPEWATPPVIMSSSKSGMIFTPKETKLAIDTPKFDIKKFKRLKN
ncbi:hypothetical protein [Ferruginibacter sp. SUN106]|uniref:hypothetical protein n=1 Tax=Ferruginibacter sp. SUN106 TaxID=2978348 RepID=UPI003D35E65A